jgi:4-hydroxy-2-oxoheptanedioate aldolase
MTLKEKLAAGRPVLGLSLMFNAPPIVEIAGALGFDWILLDCEHGALSVDMLEPLIASAESYGIAPIVRPPNQAPENILKALDRGAAGLQIPHVMNADEARAIVQAAKYHPEGERGLAVGMRSSRYGFGGPLADYLAKANRETLIVAQIEHADALPHVEAIAGVEGIDVVFVGPMDLSQSLGAPGATDSPAVKSAVDDALTRIVRAGKIAGTSGKPELAHDRLLHGVRYHYTHLTSLIANSAMYYLDLATSIR